MLVNLINFPDGHYALPGGGIEEGESLGQTALREIYEELGIGPDLLEIVSTSDEPTSFEFKGGPLIRNGISYTGQQRFFLLIRFQGADEDIRANGGEVREYIWSSYADLSNYILFEGELESALRKIQELCPESVIKYLLK